MEGETAGEDIVPSSPAQFFFSFFVVEKRGKDTDFLVLIYYGNFFKNDLYFIASNIPYSKILVHFKYVLHLLLLHSSCRLSHDQVASCFSSALFFVSCFCSAAFLFCVNVTVFRF